MDNENIRITGPLLKVLQEFLVNSSAISGSEVAKNTGLPSGTLYPVLKRLENAGWLISEWEDVDPHSVGRPRRRLYSITGVGAKLAKEALRSVLVYSGVPAWA